MKWCCHRAKRDCVPGPRAGSGEMQTQPAERGQRTVPRQIGPQAYGVRGTSSTRGDWRWAEEAVGGVSEGKLIQELVWGERQRGPWPRHQGQQKRPQEKRTVETSDTNRCHPPGHECGAGSRLDRAQEARRPLNSYQPHPPWPAQRTRDRPRSLRTEIKRGRR